MVQNNNNDYTGSWNPLLALTQQTLRAIEWADQKINIRLESGDFLYLAMIDYEKVPLHTLSQCSTSAKTKTKPHFAFL